MKKYRLLAFLGIFFALNLPANAVEPKVDFNGDGKADVFLQNVYTGEISAWLSSTSGFQTVSYGKVDPSTGWSVLGLGDFDGDWSADILWRNAYTGELYVWITYGNNSSSIYKKASLGTVSPNTGWAPIDLKDFDGDRIIDILWRNTYTGELYVWIMDGSHVYQKASLGTVDPNSGWVPIGASDFNGDGNVDLLWRHATTGELYVWLLNGSRVLQVASLGPVINPNSGWVVIDTKDFNGDGNADLLWRNATTSELYVWLLNGSRVLQMASLGTVSSAYGQDPNGGWMPIASSDFNGDGKADLLWRHATIGEFYVWLLNGSGVLQIASLGTEDPQNGWVPIGLDDFNGDGRADLFWRHAFANITVAWLINGVNKNMVQYKTVPASSVWQVQIPTQ